MQLHKIQKLFARSMLDHPDVLAKPSQELEGLFVNVNDSLTERLEIYRNNILGSLTNALLATYPLIKILTGDNFATALMHSYALENPPKRACLAQYGGGLDKFIEKYVPARQLPYLADVARLEWAINEAYYAEDDIYLTPADIEGVISWNLCNLSVCLRSSVNLLNSHWPLVKIRDFCLRYDESSSETLNLNHQGGPIMVYRPNKKVDVLSLNSSEFDFLILLQNKTLGDALGEVLNKYPYFDFKQFLQRNLQLGTFSRLYQ